jgi:hypothetical protein
LIDKAKTVMSAKRRRVGILSGAAAQPMVVTLADSANVTQL